MERRPRVLLIDDNEDATELLAMALESQGYEVRVANDGAAALAVAQEFLPAAAVVDIGLPDMDGYELAGRLRTLPGLEGTRLIALTGYAPGSDQGRATRAGFVAHLVKPVKFPELEAALRDL